jgi:hypothetical protein
MEPVVISGSSGAMDIMLLVPFALVLGSFGRGEAMLGAASIGPGATVVGPIADCPAGTTRMIRGMKSRCSIAGFLLTIEADLNTPA